MEAESKSLAPAQRRRFADRIASSKADLQNLKRDLDAASASSMRSDLLGSAAEQRRREQVQEDEDVNRKATRVTAKAKKYAVCGRAMPCVCACAVSSVFAAGRQKCCTKLSARSQKLARLAALLLALSQISAKRCFERMRKCVRASYRCIPKFWTHRRKAYACAQRPGLPQACGCG
jgi:hypothetical protein